jgi:uncharacterized protein
VALETALVQAASPEGMTRSSSEDLGASMGVTSYPSGRSAVSARARSGCQCYAGEAADILGGVEQRISLVTLGVDDLARARAFYEALGWSGAQQPDDEIVFFQAGGLIFGLWTALGGHGAPGIELAHNVRSPEEVDALLAAAERAGGTIARPAATAVWGGYTGAFADPDGYVWEVAHNPGWTLADDGSTHLTSAS